MKLTPWFTGQTKPSRTGVYQRDAFSSLYTYSYWNGKQWMWTGSTVKSAHNHNGMPSSHQCEPWRGIARSIK